MKVDSLIIDLEQEIANDISSQISKQIDDDILWAMLKEPNFPYSCAATLPSKTWEKQVEWLSANIGQLSLAWEYRTARFYFKQEKDLAMFLLKWA